MQYRTSTLARLWRALLPLRHRSRVDFREFLTRQPLSPDGASLYAPLAVGEYILSIQASAAHASHPRETLTSAFAYGEWEVAIRRRDASWVTPDSEPLFFLTQPWEPYFSRDAINTSVGKYVPTVLVQQLVDFIAHQQ